MFKKIYIEITNVCNLKCKFCPETNRKKQSMNLENFEKVISKIHKHTQLVCLHVKGENPWFALADKYKINDIVTCKVVKFASFGAFVEIEKGLEGLVHNSEITSLKRVVKPEEELQLGQTINAKIIDIDKERLKIGLSIKEIEGTSAEYGYEEYIKKQ